ncbi:MAG: biopolymer transporter ExbD [Paludibacteraceae bacterium]|nr:biopolymer transporter ExbD [Bacteroidales bacterium]
MAKGGKKKVPALNASSMADISFLLLIFFLVTTSMDVNQGLARRLPAPVPPDQKEDVSKEIKERNLFVVKINSLNQLLVQGEEINIKQLREKTKEFIVNPNNDPNLPELFTEEIEGLGEVTYTKAHVISVQNDVDTQYQAYLDVQNELVAAYNELRNEYAKQKFNGRTFNELDEEEQKLVQKVYPQKISEAEPKNYGGNK